MIPIQLNKKTYHIPSIPELTLRQFKHVVKEFTTEDGINYLKYIAHFTGLPIAGLAKTKSNIGGLGNVMRMIGSFVNYQETKPPETILGQKVEGLGLDTVGKEYQFITHIQSIKDVNQVEELTWLLAVQMGDEDDFGKVQANYDELQDMNYVDVLSAGWFFFLRSTYGTSIGRRNTGTFLRTIWTKIFQ